MSIYIYCHSRVVCDPHGTRINRKEKRAHIKYITYTHPFVRVWVIIIHHNIRCRTTFTTQNNHNEKLYVSNNKHRVLCIKTFHLRFWFVFGDDVLRAFFLSAPFLKPELDVEMCILLRHDKKNKLDFFFDWNGVITLSTSEFEFCFQRLTPDPLISVSRFPLLN